MRHTAVFLIPIYRWRGSVLISHSSAKVFRSVFRLEIVIKLLKYFSDLDMLAHFIDSKPFQCGYFKDRKSLFEEYLLEDISEVEFEYLLAHGMRHFGEYYFRPRCQNCYDCVPIRLRTDDYYLTRSQKRALRASSQVEIRLGRPQYSEEKFRLYLDHKTRFVSLQDDVEDEENFRLSFYAKTPFGMEFEYFLDGKLIGVAWQMSQVKHSPPFTPFIQRSIRSSAWAPSASSNRSDSARAAVSRTFIWDILLRRTNRLPTRPTSGQTKSISTTNGDVPQCQRRLPGSGRWITMDQCRLPR